MEKISSKPRRRATLPGFDREGAVFPQVWLTPAPEGYVTGV
jgi:hypothetical protein